MEFFIEKEYFLTLWKLEGSKWSYATMFQNGQTVWVTSDLGPTNEVVNLKDIKNDTRNWI